MNQFRGQEKQPNGVLGLSFHFYQFGMFLAKNFPGLEK
jgi:hypothetical protein